MTKRMNIRDAIEAAVEFGERFPDMRDFDVLEHVGYVMRTRYDNPNTVVAHEILFAYDHGMEEARKSVKRHMGIDIGGR